MVATTNIVGDVVANIGGDAIELTTLMPVGADPHTFEATPQDIAVIAEADVVFVNGYTMEEALMPLIENSGIAAERIIPVSAGIEVLEFEGDHSHDDHEHEEDKQSSLLNLFTRIAAAEEGHDHDHDHGGVDPHTWMSPTNVKVWVENIEAVLVALDPAHEEQYEQNAAIYIEELAALDEFIREEIAAIPQENRKLVVDHMVFGYFARDYGFRQVGAVFPSFSTLAEPSASDLAALQTTITEFGVPAIFVGSTVNPTVATRMATDAGVQLIPVFTDSLSAAGEPADTYLNMMRFTTQQIVGGLAGA
ncbi:MAG: zinc ABC transporter substrate-binding protein [Chloroflexaceae bacterium]|nr:zinc ABC transporter substrate-binding protein [Chloroflexaceae bacterium]